MAIFVSKYLQLSTLSQGVFRIIRIHTRRRDQRIERVRSPCKTGSERSCGDRARELRHSNVSTVHTIRIARKLTESSKRATRGADSLVRCAPNRARLRFTADALGRRVDHSLCLMNQQFCLGVVGLEIPSGVANMNPDGSTRQSSTRRKCSMVRSALLRRTGTKVQCLVDECWCCCSTKGSCHVTKSRQSLRRASF